MSSYLALKIGYINKTHPHTKSGAENSLFQFSLTIDDGFTPLMAAALAGKQSAFEMLLRLGANVSLKDNKGVCLLHWAVQGGDTCIINTMLSLGLETD